MSEAYAARDEQTKTEADAAKAELDSLHDELKILTKMLNFTSGTPEGTADILKDRLKVLSRLWTLEYSKVCTNPWKNSIELGQKSVVDEAKGL